MNHFGLFLICIFSIEVLVYFNFFFLLSSILQVTKKASHVLLNKNISDHWKEVAILTYSVKIMRDSMKILFILFCIVILFVIADTIISGFLKFTISLIGVIESMVFAFLYFHFKNSVIKNE